MTEKTNDPGKIDITIISGAPKEPPPKEKNDSSIDPLTGRDAKLDQNLGIIGRFIGGGSEKSGNIAFIVMIFSCFILGASLVFSVIVQDAVTAAMLDKMVDASLALIFSVLGYLFGKRSSNTD